MASTEETFSKIVRSLLLDVDIHMDQLEQIGYLSKDQRQFLDKFLYKSEDALRATAILRNINDGELQIGKLSPCEGSSATDATPSSANGLGNVTSPNVSTFTDVKGQLKAEQDALTTFLKRCSAHNFSVKVRGANTTKDSFVKPKGSEYILTLEPIAEDAEKVAVTNKFDERALDSTNFPAHMNHNAETMRYGDKNITRDMDAESVDYETALDGAGPDTVEVNHTFKKLASNDTGSSGSGTGHIETMNLGVTPDGVDIVKPVDVDIPVELDLPDVESFNPAGSLNQPSTDSPAEIKLVDGDFAHKKEQTLPGDHSDGAVTPNKQIEEDTEAESEEVETNAWGKPIKPDPTKNKEGAIVGGSAKPLGSNNKGRAMMEKMGWFNGAGLGKEKGGILEPITGVVKTSKAGLCSSEEKKRKPVIQPYVTVASNGTRKSSSSEEDTVGSGLTVTESWDGGNVSPNTDWENYSERLQADAEWAAVKQHAEAIVRNRPSFKGIHALHVRNTHETNRNKTIVFNAKIKGKNEYKTTRHYPGVVIKATSAQPCDFLNQKNGFKVSYGHHLEILCPHQGDMFHAFNFNIKKRGIVKVALVEMKEHSEASKGSVSSSNSSPVPATARA